MPNIRPTPDEYAPYYHRYIEQLRDGDVQELLREQSEAFRGLLARVHPERGRYAYAPGKWTLNEVVLHISDAERVFAYRALRIARGDTVSLHGFDENAWAPASGANDRTLVSLVEEFVAVRAATIALFRGLSREMWSKRGTASEKPVTVRALAWIACGHALHHEGIIRDRYLNE